jgi:hypothetical protein
LLLLGKMCQTPGISLQNIFILVRRAISTFPSENGRHITA